MKLDLSEMPPSDLPKAPPTPTTGTIEVWVKDKQALNRTFQVPLSDPERAAAAGIVAALKGVDILRNSKERSAELPAFGTARVGFSVEGNARMIEFPVTGETTPELAKLRSALEAYGKAIRPHTGL